MRSFVLRVVARPKVTCFGERAGATGGVTEAAEDRWGKVGVDQFMRHMTAQPKL